MIVNKIKLMSVLMLATLNLAISGCEEKQAKEKVLSESAEPVKQSITLSIAGDVTIANNHSEDYFEKGLSDTKDLLDDAGIKYSGMGEKSILDANGIKVGFLAYNGWNSNYNDEFLESIKNDIIEIKKETSLVVIYYHWGNERDNYPTQVQRDFAHFSVEYGADLVIGSHPHVLQGLESYPNLDGEEKIIAYSLGNFSFGGNKNPSDKDTMIYQQTFNFEDGRLISSEDPNVIPCSISSEKYRNNYQPTPLSGNDATRVLDRLNTYSEPFKR